MPAGWDLYVSFGPDRHRTNPGETLAAMKNKPRGEITGAAEIIRVGGRTKLIA
jgi:hypothetical protein